MMKTFEFLHHKNGSSRLGINGKLKEIFFQFFIVMYSFARPPVIFFILLGVSAYHH